MTSQTAAAHRSLGLRITVTAVAVALVIAHQVFDFVLDVPTVLLLVVAALPWLQPLLKTVEIFGMKLELRDLQETIREVDRKISLIEESAVLPGQGKPTHRAPMSDVVSEASKTIDWNDDPNRGQFGGSPRNNDRVLEATITPAASRNSAACKVRLKVRSLDEQRPLKGQVTFHLHPTFRKNAKYVVDVVDGVAEDTITAWGVFTVGAEADGGATRLELDLAKVPGGTKKFYES